VRDVVLHPDRKIRDGFRASGWDKIVLVDVVRKVYLEGGFVLERDASRRNAVAWCRNTFACGGVDVTCRNTRLAGMEREEMNDK